MRGPSPDRIEGPVPGEPFLVAVGDPSAAGYRREEWFVAGRACGYALRGERGEDGRWQALRAGSAGYRTRIVVLRPEDPGRFDGTVVVEWLNVSAGLDAAPGCLFLRRHLMRRGAVWVGVSAQKAGIEGGGLLPGGMPLERANPARYGGLVHPGDAFAFDIYTQVGRSLRARGAGPLGPLEARRLVAIGQSQSAAFLVAYANAIDPLERGFDAFLIHGRPGTAPGPDGVFARAVDPRGDLTAQIARARTRSGHRIREDVRVPVLTVQSETDVAILGGGRARQPDGERFRLWELAGAAHFDTYGLAAAHVDREGIPVEALAARLAPTAEVMGTSAGSLVNAGPQQHYVLHAALDHLVRWLRDGAPPPEAPRLACADPAGTRLLRDELGIARGGIRTPWVDAPSAVLSGEPPGGEGFLFLFGRTAPLAPDVLARLYPGGPEEHVARFDAATAAAVRAGFLLEDDAAEIRALARHGRQPSGWRH